MVLLVIRYVQWYGIIFWQFIMHICIYKKFGKELINIKNQKVFKVKFNTIFFFHHLVTHFVNLAIFLVGYNGSLTILLTKPNSSGFEDP